MSTNKKWLFALILLMYFKKRFIIFDKWGKWRVDLIFFPKIVKIMGIIPKFDFFQEKNNWEFAALKKTKSLRIKKMNISIFQIVQCCISYRNQSFDLRIIWFGMQIKWLVSIWGTKLCWNGLSWNLFISNRIYEPVRVRLQ